MQGAFVWVAEEIFVFISIPVCGVPVYAYLLQYCVSYVMLVGDVLSKLLFKESQLTKSKIAIHTVTIVVLTSVVQSGVILFC